MAEETKRRTSPTSQKLREAEKQKELEELKEKNAKYAEEYTANKTISYVEEDEHGNDRVVQLEGDAAFKKIQENDQRIQELEGVKFKDQVSPSPLGQLIRQVINLVIRILEKINAAINTIHVPVYNTKTYQEALTKAERESKKEAQKEEQKVPDQKKDVKDTQETEIGQFDGKPIKKKLTIPLKGKRREPIENKNVLNIIKERWVENYEQSQRIPESDKHSELYLINQRRRQTSNEIIAKSENKAFKSRNINKINKALDEMFENRVDLTGKTKTELQEYIKNKDYRKEDFRYVDFDLITNKKVKEQIIKEVKDSNKKAIYFLANPKISVNGKMNKNDQRPAAQAVLDRKSAVEYVVKEYLAKWYVENPTYAQLLVPNQVSDDVVHELIAQNPDIINYLTEKQMEEFHVKNERGMINVAIVENIVKKFPEEQIDEVKIMMSTTPNGAAIVEAINAVVDRNKELAIEAIVETINAAIQPDQTTVETTEEIKITEDIEQAINDVINNSGESKITEGQQIQESTDVEIIDKIVEESKTKLNNITEKNETIIPRTETQQKVNLEQDNKKTIDNTNTKEPQNQKKTEIDDIIVTSTTKSKTLNQNTITQEQREEMKKKTNELRPNKYKFKEVEEPRASASLGDMFPGLKSMNTAEQER